MFKRDIGKTNKLRSLVRLIDYQAQVHPIY